MSFLGLEGNEWLKTKESVLHFYIATTVSQAVGPLTTMLSSVGTNQ